MKKIFFSLTVLVFCGVLFLSVVDFNLNKPYYLLDIPYSKWQLIVDKKNISKNILYDFNTLGKFKDQS